MAAIWLALSEYDKLSICNYMNAAPQKVVVHPGVLALMRVEEVLNVLHSAVVQVIAAYAPGTYATAQQYQAMYQQALNNQQVANQQYPYYSNCSSYGTLGPVGGYTSGFAPGYTSGFAPANPYGGHPQAQSQYGVDGAALSLIRQITAALLATMERQQLNDEETWAGEVAA